ncbi:MAG: hypothetical protein H6R00_3005 [Proteobacteria bacterium]|nr:hypothetical protein [Pseudomonadota bacterium]
MAMTAWATTAGVFVGGDGRSRPARAELSHEGLAIFGVDGRPIALWKPTDLVRTFGPDGFRIGDRRQAGLFVFDPDTGSDLMRALAVLPDAEAPAMPRALVGTMVMIVAGGLAALFAFAWGFFWLIEWMFETGVAR